ncbi:MAG: hypothetical protein H6772_03295 [Pseudomonadales bacterium]|nr:hypothetical protein [Pseudomonadales bacterium]
MVSVSIVIPTIRNLEFLKKWNELNLFESVDLIIIEDHIKKEIKIPKIRCRSLFHYSHQDIEREFKNKAWIFPYRTSAVRSYGFYKAWQNGADIIITMDDDCKPFSQDFVKNHIENLKLKVATNWSPTYPFRELSLMRGFPYEIRNKKQVVLSHGIWANIPDLDATTQLHLLEKSFPELPNILHVFPKGVYFPMSVMNLGFSREIVPLLYQLLMGEDKNGKAWGFDRFDDIWSGVITKKIIDHLKLAAVSGSPIVWHERASNVYNNLQKEAKGIEVNEIFWKLVDEVKLKKTTPIDCYIELLDKINWLKLEKYEKYFTTLKKATLIWLNLFK